MFKGEHHYALDEKGRLVLPPKFRRALGPTVVVTRGVDGCINVYSPREWTRFERDLRALSIKKRHVVRFFLASAEDVELDQQGRMMLPAHLRAHAKIDREAVVVGMDRHLEVWSEEHWLSYLGRAQSETARLAEEMDDLSF